MYIVADDEDDEVSGLTEGDTGEPGGVGIGGRRSPMIRGTRSPRSQSPARPGKLFTFSTIYYIS
jgi:hypothetical protein